MEHKPDIQPMHRRERFNFEAFDDLIAEVLDEAVAVEFVPPAPDEVIPKEQ